MKAHGLNPRVRRRHIEGGILDHASDMTPAENPLEMGMERLVDWDKPDLLGNAALERIRDERDPAGDQSVHERFRVRAEQRAPVAGQE